MSNKLNHSSQIENMQVFQRSNDVFVAKYEDIEFEEDNKYAALCLLAEWMYLNEDE